MFELCIYFACGHYLILIVYVGLRRVQKVRYVSIAINFGHYKIDLPGNDNKRKDKARCEANIAIGLSYDPCRFIESKLNYCISIIV